MVAGNVVAGNVVAGNVVARDEIARDEIAGRSEAGFHGNLREPEGTEIMYPGHFWLCPDAS